MKNSFKWQMILWFIGGFFLGNFFYILLGLIGFYIAGHSGFILSLIVGALFAYRSYKRGKDRPADYKPAPSGYFWLVPIGGIVGFLIGYLVRPSFMGQQVPFEVLFRDIEPAFQRVKTEFVIHQIAATVIGLLIALVICVVIKQLRRPPTLAA